MINGQRGIGSNPNCTDAALPWRKESMRLQFIFAGKLLFVVHLPALILDAPFNRATSNSSKIPSAPKSFAEGIEATQMHSCPLAIRARPITLRENAIRYIPSQYEHSYVDLSGSFEDYLRKFSSKTRWTLRKILIRVDGDTASLSIEFRHLSRIPIFAKRVVACAL